MEKEWTRVVCIRDVQQMNMGSLVDEEDDNSKEVIEDNFKADA